jgi:hypothetical protein
MDEHKRRGSAKWRVLITLVLLLFLGGWLYWPHWAGTAGATDIEKRRDAPFLHPDPATLDAFLQAVVDEAGFIDYQRAMQPEVRQHLDAYLAETAKATPAQFASDNERLAFYINAYNALTIEGVLHYWPLESVKDVGFLSEFFREKRYQIAGQLVSLHGFESKVIKKYDPLHHFGLNCASVSCPPLLAKAYRAENLKEKLGQQAYRYLTDRNHNYFNYNNRTWYLSAIFDWYSDDFGGRKGVIAFINEQLPAISDPYTIEYRDYDWRLNSSGTKPMEELTLP